MTPPSRPRLPLHELGLVVAASCALLDAAWREWLPIRFDEALGFVSGGACVWLVVREHLANWPLGLLNNAVFFLLFLRARLYADMGLQVVYFALGVYGWWTWVRGGTRSGPLAVTRTPRGEWIAVALFLPAATLLMREALLLANGAAPLPDALTTALSLAAQYLLCRKRLENWLLWIVADLIYVPLYVSRGLPLTALLYALFLVLCLVGLRTWLGSLRASEAAA